MTTTPCASCGQNIDTSSWTVSFDGAVRTAWCETCGIKCLQTVHVESREQIPLWFPSSGSEERERHG